MNRILEILVGSKIRFAIFFICWSVIYKIIDMNTLQWFGRDIFVDGNVLGFFLASFVALCLAFLPIGLIYEFFDPDKNKPK